MHCPREAVDGRAGEPAVAECAAGAAPRSGLVRQVALAAVCAAYAVGAALGWGSEELALIMGDFGLSVAALLASGSCLWYARTRAGEFRAAWVLFGLSSLMVGLGNAVWGWYEVVLGEPVPRTSVADLCFLLFAPLAIVGLLLLAKRPVSRAGWLCLGLDASLIAGSLLALSWSVALTHTAQSQGETVIRAALALAYPLLDIVLVTMVLVLHFRRTAAHRAAVNTALGALSLTVLCDALFTSPLLRDQYSSGQLLDAGWFAGSLLLACAPWTPSATAPVGRPADGPVEAGSPSPEADAAAQPDGSQPTPATEISARHAPDPPLAQPLSGPIAALTPYLAAAVCTLSILITVTKGRAVDPVVVGTACAVVLALLVRQGITLRDNIILAGELAQQESHFRSLVQGSSDVIMIAAPDGVLRYVSPAAAGVYGLPAEELVGRRLSDLIHADDLGRVEFELRRFLSVPPARESVTRVECRVLHGGGRWLNVESSVNRHHSGLIFNSRDVTERVRLQAQLQHSASHDALTDLPNRALFTERLRQAIDSRRTGEGTPAVFYIDLDGFKAVNDTAGHQAGDELLIQAARRLRDSVRSGDTTARLGGDEFAALLSPCPAASSGDPGTPTAVTGGAAGDDCHAGGEPCRSGQVRTDQVLDIAERVRTALSRPYLVEGREVRVAASIGIAFATPGCTPAVLLREADVAMYRAKQAGKGRVELYDPESHGQGPAPATPVTPSAGGHHAARTRPPRGVARTAAQAVGEDAPAERTRAQGVPCPLIPAARSGESPPPALRLTHQPQVSLEDGAVHGLALRLISSAGSDWSAVAAQGATRAVRSATGREAPEARGGEPLEDGRPSDAPPPPSARAGGPGAAETGPGRLPSSSPQRVGRSGGLARAAPPVRWLAVRSARVGGRGTGRGNTGTAPRRPEAVDPVEEPTRPARAGGPRPVPRERTDAPSHRPGGILVDLAAAGAAERRRRGHELPVTVPLRPEAVLSATVSAETVAATLARYDLPARALTLALTDAGPLLDDADYRRCLDRLGALGVGIAVDLGDGAVPPAALRRLPITEMLLARTLVAGLPDSARARTTVTALVALGGELGLVVVADGVDRPDQAAVLRSLGCRRGQGAALGGPLDEVALAAALRAGDLRRTPSRRAAADPGPLRWLREA
ncbi:diguanylate cyclase domain-containing protein, partial [Streptomyces spiramenti]|nr:diguanylate cyclase [Streptomyces spiramenti]